LFGAAVIARDAEPIGNRNPYKRIDLAAKRRPPAIITQEDYDNGVIPDEGLYTFNPYTRNWELKE
jgi:hypothetical protein